MAVLGVGRADHVTGIGSTSGDWNIDGWRVEIQPEGACGAFLGGSRRPLGPEIGAERSSPNVSFSVGSPEEARGAPGGRPGAKS